MHALFAVNKMLLTSPVQAADRHWSDNLNNLNRYVSYMLDI